MIILFLVIKMDERILVLYPNSLNYLPHCVFNFLENTETEKKVLFITWDDRILNSNCTNIVVTNEHDINEINILISLLKPHTIIFDDYALDIVLNSGLYEFGSLDDARIVVCVQCHTFYRLYYNKLDMSSYKTIYIPEDFLCLKHAEYPNWNELIKNKNLMKYSVLSSEKRITLYSNSKLFLKS
jgi:hypothetical protein